MPCIDMRPDTGAYNDHELDEDEEGWSIPSRHVSLMARRVRIECTDADSPAGWLLFAFRVRCRGIAHQPD